MAKYTCKCGAVYSLREGSAGKKAKCKKCGDVFVIPEEPAVIPLAVSDDDWDFDPPSKSAAPAMALAAPGLPPGGLSAQTLDEAKAYVEAGRVAPIGPGGQRTFFGDFLWSLLFFADLRNSITFLFVWFVLSLLLVAPFSGCFFIPITLFIAGWYSAFRFEIIAKAANGEDDLPGFSIEDWMEDVFGPLLKWVVTWLVTLAPAYIFLTYALITGLVTPNDVGTAAAGGIAGMMVLAKGNMVFFGVLLVAALIAWPMMALSVGLGGIGCIVQVPRMIKTAVRTAGAYAAVVGVMIGFMFMNVALQEASNASILRAAGGGVAAVLSKGALWYFLLTGVSVYGEIVTLRMIGLYYHHCKDRFAWSWG